MNLDRLGQWVGILANVGVFAGFLLVAYQLHQNTLGLQSASISTSNQIFASTDIAMMGDTTYEAFAQSLTDPSRLTPAELAQMWGYFSASTFSANVAYIDYQQGIITEDHWLAVRDTYVSFINHPIGRLIWVEQSKRLANSRNRGFFDSVQERLLTATPNESQYTFRAMLEAARALPPEDAPATGSDRPPDVE